MNLANKITMSRILMLPLLLVALQRYPDWMVDKVAWLGLMQELGLYLALFLFLLIAATDKWDGYVARKYGLVTNLGKLLDPLADKLLIAGTLLMLVMLGLVPGWAAFIIIAREAVITAIRVAASAQGIALAADRYGKLKMVLQVAALAVVMASGTPAVNTIAAVGFLATLLLYMAVAVTLLSGCNYILANYKKLGLDQ